MQNKKSRTLMLILVAVLCLSVCIGLTYAYFTDSATSRNNKIQAGKLKLDLELYDKETGWSSIKDSSIPVFNYEKWEPGYTDVKILNVVNKGDLAIQWEAILVSQEVASAFANAINVYVKTDSTEITYPVDRAAALEWTHVGTLADFINTNRKIASGTFTAEGESTYIGIALNMPAEIEDNSLQGQVLGAFDIQINATQYTYEEDAFGSDYDTTATPPNGGVTPPDDTEDTTEPTETEPEPTDTETEPTETEPEPTETEPTETEPIEPTDPSIFTWALNDDRSSYTVTGLVESGSVENVVIPATYRGLPVTRVGTYAFNYDYTITSVTIPEGVTTIEDQAFYNCGNLQSVSIPDSIMYIGEDAFYECYNLNYNEYDNAYYLGNDVNDCVVLMRAKDTSIQSCDIHENTKIIYHGAFNWCSGLSGELTIPNSVTQIGNSAFYYCSGLTGELTIPNSVTTIGDEAFGECFGLTGELNIPNSVTTIGSHTFHGCHGFTELTIGNNVTTIGGCAFISCSGLTEITIPNNVTNLEGHVFQGCSNLEKAIIGNGVTSLFGTFSSCHNLVEVEISNSVISIDSYTFDGCYNLTEITIPYSVTAISEHAFRGCSNLTSFVVDVDNTAYQAIDGNLYSKDGTVLVAYAIGKTETSFEIPGSVTTIGDYAFNNADNLTNVTIPNSVTTIGNSAFNNVDNLTSVTIPNSVTEIGSYAFSYCSGLKSVFLSDSITTWGYHSFANCENSIIIYCSVESAPSNWDDGWNCRNDGHAEDHYEFIPVIYGWTGEEYTYTFEVNGGNPLENITSTLGFTLPTPQKDGSNFMGWYDNAAFDGEALTFDFPYYSTTKHTLYAKWMTEENCFNQAVNMQLDKAHTTNVSAGGQKVYYAFTPDVSGTYVFASVGNQSTYASLYDSALNQLTPENLDRSSGNFTITQDLEAGQTYYLVVKLYDESAIGSFDVAVTRYIATDEEGFAQATVITPNNEYPANIVIGGQKAYYAFTPDVSGTYRFWGFSNSYIDTYGILYDSNGVQLHSEDGGGNDGHFAIEYYLEAGQTYYFVAKHYNDYETCMFTVTLSRYYTYTFETNGAEPIDSISSATEITLPTLYRYDGAIFCGWYDNAAFDGEALTSPYRSTDDCTLYAKWLTEEQMFEQATEMQLNTNYTVNITAYGQKGYFVFTAPTSGYYGFYSTNNEFDTFGYLYDSSRNEIKSDDDSGEGNNFLISKYMEAGETCYLVAGALSDSNTGSFDVAVGIQITYTFETNGGDYVSEITSAGSITLPTTEKYQAIFAGWYDNPDCTGNALASPYSATESCTLYAKWFTTAEECDANATVVEETDSAYPTNITFGSQRVLYSFTPDQNATYSIWLSGDYGAYCEVYNSNLYRVYGSTDEEEDFKAFVYLSAGETYYFVVRYYDGDKTGSFDVIVESPYTYTFNAMGGYVDTESITSAAEIELPTPSMSGAIFLGWYDNADYDGDAIWHYYRATSDCTLYARWITTEECADQATTITLGNTYPANITAGGQRLYFAFIPTVSGAYAFSSIAGSDVDPYGYLYDANLNFLDSNDDEGDGMDEEPNRNFSIIRYLTAGETYYLAVKMSNEAKTGSFDITVNTATLYTFETNGGNSIESIASGEAIYLPTPNRVDGATFMGWYDNAACEGTALTSPYYSATDCTLYAKWWIDEELFDQATEIELDNIYAADITFEGERKYYAFTPTESGTYTFYSIGDMDTYGYLYDTDRNLIAYNDDGNGNQFLITYELEAGETYYLAARFYSENNTGSFDVAVIKGNY